MLSLLPWKHAFHRKGTFVITRRILLGAAGTGLLLPTRSLYACPSVDGHANAPAGTPQYPTLLAGYAARPPWQVAGVDYHVGIPSTTNLKPVVNGAGVLSNQFPGNLSGFNIFANASAPVTGWDFSVHGGYSLIVSGNAVITNSKFLVGTNNPQHQTPIVSSNTTSFTMTNCFVDGNTVDTPGNAGQLVQANGTSPGPILIQYNHIRNAWGECFQFGMNGPCNSLTFRYNIIENAGLGVRIPAEQTHGDWAQIWGGGNSPANQLTTGICNYNLFWQNLPIAQTQTQGWNWMCAGANASYYQTMDMSNNTAITSPGAGVNAMLMANTTWLGTPSTNGSGTAFNNYVAFAGGLTDFGPTVWGFFGNNNGAGPSGVGPRTTVVGIRGNINMVTGAAAPGPDGNNWANV